MKSSNYDDEDDRNLKPFPGPNAPRQPQYQFTPEELRVLRECNKESFYQRCLPLCTLFGTSTYFGVKSGYLHSNVRYGAVPKVVVSVVVGYFLGKFSYQAKCADKLMQLPNSRVGEMLRQRRRGQMSESMDPGFGPGMSLAPFGSMNSADTYTDLNPQNSLDIDTSRPENKGLDDRDRPSMDNPIYEEEMPPIQKHSTTYEELRKRNRDEYQHKRLGNVRDTPREPSQKPSQPTPGYSESSHTLGRPTNKYGDSFE